MSVLHLWRHPSRKTVVFFLSVSALSVATLVWMGLRLVKQDRVLETQRLEERREVAADRIIASLEQVLLAEERKLASLPRIDFLPPADEIIFVLAGSSEIRVWPDNGLLYYPVIPPGREATSYLYADAERSEFLYHNYNRAVLELRPLSQAEDPAVRIGAQLRMARNLRKAGDIHSALEIYAALAESPDQGVTISGVPADLAARRTCCVLLEELSRRDELQQEAQNLNRGLRERRWRLDKASYLYYSDLAAQWLRQEPEPDTVQTALAETVDWLWQNRRAIANVERGSAGRKLFRSRATSITILWQVSNEQLSAVLAGPSYQQSQWFTPVLGSSEFNSIRVSIFDPENELVYGNEPPAEKPVTSRPASVTGLPWDISIINKNLEGELNQFALRRRLMIMVLGMLAFLIIAASYFIGRSVSRELAAARLQSDFVSAVSHEFRTPLTSMRQFTEMLVENENLSPEKRKAFYSAQERATRRLSRLVESLLDFGRMEAGARPYRLEPLDIGQLVRSTAEEFKQEVNSSSIQISWKIPKNGPLVKADREAIAQALWNLLDNAVKYSGDNPVIRIEVENGNQVAIRVQDQGIGIPSSEKDRILRKFVRGSSAKAYGIKGTGIGLAMVKHIVDAHGGKVQIASELGKGSTFTILLPTGG